MTPNRNLNKALAVCMMSEIISFYPNELVYDDIDSADQFGIYKGIKDYDYQLGVLFYRDSIELVRYRFFSDYPKIDELLKSLRAKLHKRVNSSYWKITNIDSLIAKYKDNLDVTVELF